MEVQVEVNLKILGVKDQVVLEQVDLEKLKVLPLPSLQVLWQLAH